MMVNSDLPFLRSALPCWSLDESASDRFDRSRFRFLNELVSVVFSESMEHS